MTDDDLLRELPRARTRTDFQTTVAGLGAPYRGKVRDVYPILGRDELLLVTTDRISAFDHVFDAPIPFKGEVLNRIAAHVFERIGDIAPHHLIALPHGRATVARACTPVPVEFVVRGHLAGHALRTYQAGERSLCGVALPEGLRPYDPLPSPILTPATKAAEGHDEDTTLDAIVQTGVLTRDELEGLHDLALRVFARGQALAHERGLVLLDTKFEFGRDRDGTWRIIDEVLTPDSSRYVYADSFEDAVNRGEAPRHLSKEFLREELLAAGYRGEGPPPALSTEQQIAIGRRYLDLFQALTGHAFIPDPRSSEDAITDYLAL